MMDFWLPRVVAVIWFVGWGLFAFGLVVVAKAAAAQHVGLPFWLMLLGFVMLVIPPTAFTAIVLAGLLDTSFGSRHY